MYVRLGHMAFDDEHSLWVLQDILKVPSGASEKICSGWRSHTDAFYASLKFSTQTLVPDLIKAPLVAIHCIMIVLDYIIRHQIDDDETKEPGRIQHQIFSQIFQLSSSQGGNVITYRQPFLAYHRMMASSGRQAFANCSLPNDVTTPSPLPIPSTLAPKLSLDLFTTDSNNSYAWLLASLLCYVTNPSFAGSMFMGPLSDITSCIEDMGMPSTAGDADS